jgi:hypothetical protein
MKQNEIIERFMKRKAEIDNLLLAIQGMSDDHFGIAPEDINMGHVGNLAHAAHELKGIYTFLKGGGIR